ncbi:hypothetical protein FRC10_007935 [Ceratobasidium sp. 414]|nr:hypothetical protein FRC10_007935 [Ceratobasidium sp. 414]
MSVHQSPIDFAFQSWKAARDQLVNVVDTYTTACTKLQSTLYFNRPSVYEDHSQFDAVLLKVEAEVHRFELLRRVLENGVYSLRKTRNLSFTLTPINMLPQSLLLSIFSTLIDLEYADQMYLPRPSRQIRNHPALTISSVCTSWRNLALESPTVWSTILLHPNDLGYSSSQLSLTRAGNVPLDIKVPYSPYSYMNRWLSLLGSRHEQIRSLDLVLATTDELRQALALWPQGSLASSLKTLSVKICNTVLWDDEIWDNTILAKVIPDGAHNQFLHNITSLSLYGGYFDWDSAAFAGLEHLQVAWVARSATLGQLIGMLRASPRLRTLCLVRVPIAEGETEEYEPVHLVRLERLSLIPFAQSEYHKLIPLLLPGSSPLAVHTGWSYHDHQIEVFLALFRRSNIESMYFHERVDRRSLSDIFTALPRLCRLYCSNNSISDILEALSAATSPNYPGTGISFLPCPQLRAVYFRQCKFDATNRPLLKPITNQPTLIVKCQDCELPPSTQLHLSRLVLGDIQFELIDSGLPYEPPLDGVDYLRAPSESMQTSEDHEVFHIHLNR